MIFRPSTVDRRSSRISLIFGCGIALCAVVSPACQGDDDLCVGAVAMSNAVRQRRSPKEQCKALSSDDAQKLQDCARSK